VPPTSLPPAERSEVVLHVGMGKTGTSSLQAMLHHNRAGLVERGVLYPASPGRRRHLRLGLAMQSEDRTPPMSLDWRRQQVSTPAELRPLFEDQLFAELAAARAPRLLFSDEALFGSTDDGIRNLRDLMDRIATTVRVVVYLRRQDDHLASRYQQEVKRAGEVRRLAARLDQADFSHKYDYHARLRAWRALMHPDAIVVRAFEPERFADGSLARDFLEATGLGIRPDELDAGPVRNESVDAESVEFLRILNLHRRDQPGEIPGLMAHNRILRRLERTATGPTLTLPDERLDAFMSLWEDSNRAVARDFLDDAGALFANPRKTRNTTTEQLLDPARLDHFSELLELPSELLVPLRRIAEREAAHPG